jgi:hypothetical protein
MEKRLAHITGEYYTHQTIWRHAKLLIILAEEKKEAATTLFLSALLLIHCALESYLNYLGEKVFPAAWENERETFKAQPYRGTLGKMAFLRDNLGVIVEKGKRPHMTVKRLDAWRHSVVHGRTEIIDKEIEFTDPRRLTTVQSKFLRNINAKLVQVTVEDVEEVCDQLQSAAYERYHHLILGPKAFRGISSHQGGSIKS